jgi:hypothetical protein
MLQREIHWGIINFKAEEDFGLMLPLFCAVGRTETIKQIRGDFDI